MIWPFKPRKFVLTFDEFVATQPDTPCGEKRLHYDWKMQRGLPCPACAGLKERERFEREQDRMAERIAAHVVAKLKEQS